MAISYNPKDAVSTWPDGEYDAVMTSVIETKSKTSGQDMWKTTIEVYNAEGKKRTLTEFFTIGKGLFRLKQLAEALGKLDSFNAAEFSPYNAVDRRFTVTLGTQEAQGQYGEKNIIEKFSSPKGATSIKKPSPAKAAASPVSSDEQFKDEDIPF